MKQTLLLLQLMALFSVCYSDKCTYMSTRTGAITVKTCDSCCKHDCCPWKPSEPSEPIDGKYIAIIVCCPIVIPAIIVICIACVVPCVRRRRLAQLQARNREIAAEHLTTLFILSSLRQQEGRATGSEVTSSLADPPRYETVVEGQS